MVQPRLKRLSAIAYKVFKYSSAAAELFFYLEPYLMYYKDMQFTFDKKDPSSFPFNSIMVSALIERETINGIEILLQTRSNTNDSVYFGTLEVPAGHIDKFENVYETVKREVLEETGLTVTEFLDDYKTEEFSTKENDAAFAFQPFICQQYLRGPGWSWIGFTFRCHASGTLKEQIGESSKHRWVHIAQVKKMLEENPNQFFTLQLPLLKYYISFHEKKAEK